MSFKITRRAMALTLSILIPAHMHAGYFSWQNIAQAFEPVKKYAAVIGAAGAALFAARAYIRWQIKYENSIEKYMQDIDDLHQDLSNAEYWFNKIFEKKAQQLLKERIQEWRNLEKQFGFYFPVSIPQQVASIQNIDLLKEKKAQKTWNQAWKNHQSKRDQYAKKINESLTMIGEIEQQLNEFTYKPQKAKHGNKKHQSTASIIGSAISGWFKRAFSKLPA